MKGHIRERSPGHWAIVLENRDPVTGKRKRRWHSFRGTKREAQVECSRLITELAGGMAVDPSRMTVAAYLAHWLAHKASQVSPRTAECYQEIIDTNIAPLIGSLVVGKLRPADVARMNATALERGRKDGGGLSPRSVQMMHRLLSQALKQAVRWQMIARNPCDVVSPPRVERKPMKVPDAPDAAALIEAARPGAMFMPVLLAVLCGLRRGEIAALRWKDIETGKFSISASMEQTRKGGVRRKPPKSGRGRPVSFAGLALDELRRHRIRQAEDLLKLGVRQTDETYICLQPNFEPWAPRNLSSAFLKFMIKFVKASGLAYVRGLHRLRHAHASHLLLANVHPKIVQERLGHANIATTMDLYSHIMPGMQEEAAGLVDAAMQTALNKHREGKA